MIKISFTTATELCLIEKTKPGTADVPSQILIKEQKVLATNKSGAKVPFYTPIYSGNSFRGKLRRECLSIVLEQAVKNGVPMPSADDFNLMNAGGGSNFQSQAFKVEDEVRKLNPIISVFGASLAVAGKLKTSNLMPLKNVTDESFEYYAAEGDDGRLFSPITGDDTFYKVDDILDRKGNAKYLDDETIEAWQSHVENNQKKLAVERAKKEAGEKVDDSKNRVKKESVNSQLIRKFVVRGVDFYGSLKESAPLTEIERGMIYVAIERMVLENLGSNKARNFGLVNYTLEYDDGSVLETRVNEYLVPEIVKKDYKSEVSKDIAAFTAWLEELSSENLNIATLMK